MAALFRDSTKDRMSSRVTRPPRPVPGTSLMSTPYSRAILRTTGELRAIRNSPVVMPSRGRSEMKFAPGAGSAAGGAGAGAAGATGGGGGGGDGGGTDAATQAMGGGAREGAAARAGVGAGEAGGAATAALATPIRPTTVPTSTVVPG